ncbi:MAG: GTP-binding protein [Rhodobacteraceae bacterium]|nr:GTP-binding protein [Paracoccaceae bacterium]
MADHTDKKIPVIIITGFLGSGKTTILNHIVKQPEMKATAVIINEFGEVGIDHMLVETSEEQMIEMNNGCICCTIRGDLADKLGSLAMWLDTGRVPPVERVIVETTGLADPAPIMHTLMTDETLLDRYRLDSVITVVDAIVGGPSLARFSEAVKQVAIADRLILTKGDLVASHSSPSADAALRARLAELNPRATVHDAVNGRIDAALLQGAAGDDAQAAIRDFSDWLSAAECGDDEHRCHDHHHDHHHAAHAHQRAQDPDGITSFVIRIGKAVDGTLFNDFLQTLVIEFGERLLRLKGILNVRNRPDAPAVIHGVQHVLFPVSWLDHWPDDARDSRLVFITQGLDRQTIQKRFDAAFA